MADSRPLFARSLVIQPPRRLKLHWSTAFESQNPCHTCPHAVEFPIRSTLIACFMTGTVMMTMMNNTSMTSTKSAMFISSRNTPLQLLVHCNCLSSI